MLLMTTIRKRTRNNEPMFGYDYIANTDVLAATNVSWVVLFLLSSCIAMFFYRSIVHMTDKQSCDDGLFRPWLHAVRMSCYGIVLLLWLGFNASLLLAYTSALGGTGVYYLGRVMELTATVLVSWFLLSSIDFAEERFALENDQLDPKAESTVFIAFQLAKMLVYVFIAVAVLSIFDLHELAVSLFTAGAVGTVLIGLAAREALSNVFSSLMLLCDRPFKPKDLIALPEHNIEGVVESIGWRITKIRRPDKKVQYVPNMLFSTASIINYAQMTQRRIRLHFGVRYGDLSKVKQICTELESSFAEFDFVDKRVDSFVCLHDFQDSQVVLRLQVFTRPSSFKAYNKAIDTVMHKVVDCVHGARAAFAFPTTTLDAKDLVAALRDRVETK